MSVSYVSSVGDVAGVQTAISHLLDLQANMCDVYGFQHEDTAHIDVIIQCIHDLEEERSKAHELLETETIKASVLRHKLLCYPEQIKKEISDAVGAARRDNEEELASLNKQLNSINADIVYSSEKLKQLDDLNGVLKPELVRVRLENSDIIAKLNDCMSEKAVKQIILNETRDKLRNTNHAIADLEEGLVILKEDLIQERNDHRIEKNRLNGLMTDAVDKTKDQKYTNALRKVELTTLRGDRDILKTKFNAMSEETLRLERKIESCTKEAEKLGQQFENQLGANKKLRQKIKELDEHGVQMDRDFEQRKTQAIQRIEKLNRDIDSEKDRGELLEKNLKEVEIEFQTADEIRKNYEAKVAELKEQLLRAQNAYKSRVEAVGHMTQENNDMEFRLIEMAEAHDMFARNLNAELAAEKEKLELQRKERLDLQSEREISQATLAHYRGDQQKYLRDTNKHISNLRSQHEALSEEGRHLNRTIKQYNIDIGEYSRDYEKACADYSNMKQSLEFIIDRTQTSIARLQKDAADKQQTLVEMMPGFNKLEKEHNEVADKFDIIKKNIVALKNKKLGLENSTQRVQSDIEKLTFPKVGLENELKKGRDVALQQLKAHADARTSTERELYSVGVKLKTVLEENDRFRAAVKKVGVDTVKVNTEMDVTTTKKDSLIRCLEEKRIHLIRAWLEDENLTSVSSVRDQSIVVQFSDLLERTNDRQRLLAAISHSLYNELTKLGSFMRDVSRKRPLDSEKNLNI